MRAHAALLIAAMTCTGVARADAQVVAPGATPLCTSPGVPAGCRPAQVEEPPASPPPQVPIPSTPGEIPRSGAVTPPATGDEEMVKTPPPTGPNSTPVLPPNRK